MCFIHAPSHLSDIRAIFASIRRAVQDKFPENPKSHYTCITAFLFLRLYCVALVVPHTFRLISEVPSEKMARNLSHLSRTLINLANKNTFGMKDNAMQSVNPWIVANEAKLEALIDGVVSFKEVSSSPRRFSSNYAEDMSRVYAFLVRELPKVVAQSTSDPFFTQLLAVVTALTGSLALS